MAQLANLTTTLAIESASFVNGIEQSRGAVRRLVASLDPAAAAQAKFNRQMDLAERGLKSGQLSADLYAKVVERLKQRLDTASVSGSRLAATNGQMRAGMQQLSYQIGDVATGFAMGQGAMRIFGQQSAQIIQSVQLMTTSTKGFLGVLAGPWGLIISSAATLAVSLGSALFDGADAADAMADHQDTLADYVDMTTGRIKEQVAAISLLVEAQRQSKSLEQQVGSYRSNRNALIAAGATGGRGEFSSNLFAPGNSAFNRPLTDSERQIKSLAEQYRRGEINANAFGVAVHRIGLQDPTIRRTTDEIERLADSTVRSAQAAGKTQAVIAVLAGTATDAQKKLVGINIANDEAAGSHRRAASAAHSHAIATKEVAEQIDLVASVSRGAMGAVADWTKVLSRSQEDIRRAQDAQFKRIFGDDDEFGKIVEAASTAYGAEQDMRLTNERDLQRLREDNIRDLGHMYFDLFDGGTKRFLENFQRQGLAIISEMLARWTLGGGGSGGGLFGGLLKGLGGLIGGGGSAPLSSANLGGFNISGVDTGIQFAGLPAFASGGSFQFGGRDGIDKNILSLNDSPIAKVTKGEVGIIKPVGVGTSGGRGDTHVHVSVNAQDAVLTETVKGWVAVGVSEGIAKSEAIKGKKAERFLGSR